MDLNAPGCTWTYKEWHVLVSVTVVNSTPDDPGTGWLWWLVWACKMSDALDYKS